MSHPWALRATAPSGHQRDLLILMTTDWYRGSWRQQWGLFVLCPLPQGSGNKSTMAAPESQLTCHTQCEQIKQTPRLNTGQKGCAGHRGRLVD